MTDLGKRNLEGSPSRDRFKRLHKQRMPKWCYALNSDLELVEKHPEPFCAGRLDFKTLGDHLTFTEAIMYNIYTQSLAPVYLVEAQMPSRRFVEADPDQHRFIVYRFKSADWHPEPPTVEKEAITGELTWEELSEWENKVRTDARNKKWQEYHRQQNAVESKVTQWHVGAS